MTDLQTVKAHVAETATYISLTPSNPELTRIEPWCGHYPSGGPAAMHKVFVGVAHSWETLSFTITNAFSGVDEQDGAKDDGVVNVAVFGTMVLKSRVLGKVVESPVCVWSRVATKGEDKGKVVFMQFMEDTLGTANSFRKMGGGTYVCDPDTREEVVVEDKGQ